MIFKWPSGHLDHWHLFKRKLLYRALGHLNLDWHSDSLTDTKAFKSSRLGEKIKKGKWKDTRGDVKESRVKCHSDTKLYSGAVVRQLVLVNGGRGQTSTREDMHAYGDVRDSLNPSQHQWEYSPSSIPAHTHTHTHIPCSSILQVADTEVLVIAMLMVWWLISPSHAWCVRV